MTGDPFWQAIRAQGLQVSPVVEAFHFGHGVKIYGGTCKINRGRGVFARLALWLAGFPPAGQDVPTRITITTSDHSSTWERDFDGHLTRSHLFFDLATGQVVERFGPIRLALAVAAEDDRLRIAVASMRVLGMPVPRALLPRSDTTEAEGVSGQFRFDVSARVPGIGLLISYRGDLRPEPPP